jgi:hypothetical protein
VGELGGDLPEGFDLQNSPSALESLGEPRASCGPAFELRHADLRRGCCSRGGLRRLPAEFDRPGRPSRGSPPAVAMIGAGSKASSAAR